MFNQRITLYPALGKGPEVRALLEERTKARQAQGIRVGLSTQLFNPDGAVFVQNSQWPDLAAWDQNRQRLQADPALEAFQQKLNPLLTRPNKLELFEVLIPFQAGAPGKFAQRSTNYPALGKGPEVRPLVEERVKARQAQGIRASLATQLFNPDGPVFVMGLLFPDLAALEQYRQGLPSDSAAQALTQKMNQLVSRALKLELFEVLIAPPA